MKLAPPDTLVRLPYLIRWLLYILAVGLVAAATVPFVREEQLPFLLVVLVPVALVYRVVWLDLPRARSIPWNPWILLLALIPGVAFIIQLLLFFVPAKVVST